MQKRLIAKNRRGCAADRATGDPLKPLFVFRFAICITAVVLFLAASATAEINVVPKPREVEERQGRFVLQAPLTIALPAGANDDDRFAAQLLQEEIVAVSRVKAKTVPGAEGQIVLAAEGAPEQVGEEGYLLDVTPRRVTLQARTSAGLFYGVQTLRQLMARDGIRAVRVTDWPAMRWRGLHDDLSRGPIPTTEYIKRQLRTCAEYKINLYSFYVEHTFAYRSHPLIGPRGGSLTAAELKDLVAYARKYHIEIVPEQQAFGHLHHVLKWEKYSDLGEVPYGHVLSPANPETYKFIKSLYDELVPLFPGRFLHIGSDETVELGAGQSRPLVSQIGLGRAYFNHLKRVTEILAPYKKRLMFWGDIAMHHPDLLPELPKDLIVMSWDYSPRESFDNYLKPFRDAGLDVFVCPGVNNWNRIFPNHNFALPNIRDFIRDGQKFGALGVMNTTWDDDGEALFGMTWYAVLYGAAASWQPGSSDLEEFHDRFDWAFFRNPSGSPFAEAIARLNRVHILLAKAGVGDAHNSLFWLNPFHPEHRAALERIHPVAREVRLAAESALEILERNAARARRNADQLDYLRLAAHRLDYIGFKALYARQISDLYRDAYENQNDPRRVETALERINQMNGLLQDGRDFSTAIREEYRAAWLAENRPYWLGNVLALYDRETRLWLDKITEFYLIRARYRADKKLPPPEEVGLAAPAGGSP